MISCKNEIVVKQNVEKPKLAKTTTKTLRHINQSEIIENQIFKNCSAKSIPITDSTNFDNHKYSKLLNTNEQKFLKLAIIRTDPNETAEKISLNYILNLSKKYKTVIVTKYLGDHEMFTYLINYNNNYEILGFTQIAYDEIAESWGRMTSNITQKNILVTDFNYAIEPVEIVELKYQIENSGIITKIK